MFFDIYSIFLSICSESLHEIRYARRDKDALSAALCKFYGEYSIPARTGYPGQRGKEILTTVRKVTIMIIVTLPVSSIIYRRRPPAPALTCAGN